MKWGIRWSFNQYGLTGVRKLITSRSVCSDLINHPCLDISCRRDGYFVIFGQINTSSVCIYKQRKHKALLICLWENGFECVDLDSTCCSVSCYCPIPAQLDVNLRNRIKSPENASQSQIHKLEKVADYPALNKLSLSVTNCCIYDANPSLVTPSASDRGQKHFTLVPILVHTSFQINHFQRHPNFVINYIGVFNNPEIVSAFCIFWQNLNLYIPLYFLLF